MRPATGLPQRVVLSAAYLLMSVAGYALSGPALCQAQAESAPDPPKASAAPAAADSPSIAAAVQDLERQVRELRAAVAEMREESRQYREESAALRRQLETAAAPAPPPGGSAQAAGPANATPGESGEGVCREAGDRAEPSQPAAIAQKVSALEENLQLLTGKVDDQYQTKIESASKYRVRLSGIVLMNLFSNRGTTDNQDFPSFALPAEGGASSGNFGATLRQSEIGLEVFGPTLAGAKLSGSVQADFAGGFPYTSDGVDSGYFRLRTASARLDWKDTALVAGQDDLFISPLSPTSFASLAVPALNYAGNLWGWIPQVRVEHRLAVSDSSSLRIQAGVLDNLAGEYPSSVYWSRVPGPGESSGQPAYALRTSWEGDLLGRRFSLGGAGYYSPQNWGFDRRIDGWAGMTDWNLPLAPRLEWSGELYRGRAIGGIGGGGVQSVYFESNPDIAGTQVYGLDTAGGWSQLKFKASAKLEFNLAFGLDNPFAAEVRSAYRNGPYLEQNRGWLGNFIYRPRSNLLFSAEYRRLRTAQSDTDETAGQVNLMMGVLF